MDPRSLNSFTDVLKITMSVCLKLTNVKMWCLSTRIKEYLVERTKSSVNGKKVPVKFQEAMLGFGL